ncbi:MAG: hypothetical protein UW70_C0048G0015 [Candidatus Peregrinibacteria bacterium GW2011_GWA2_44_7]|nr:MAG: hypothetical protein UW70_C0048G0015 [Candidatus Peregrinibacteria bacterium GW2011_GWA2_44_7]
MKINPIPGENASPVENQARFEIPATPAPDTGLAEELLLQKERLLSMHSPIEPLESDEDSHGLKEFIEYNLRYCLNTKGYHASPDCQKNLLEACQTLENSLADSSLTEAQKLKIYEKIKDFFNIWCVYQGDWYEQDGEPIDSPMNLVFSIIQQAILEVRYIQAYDIKPIGNFEGAVPPPEVFERLKKEGLSPEEILSWGWTPWPALKPTHKHISREKLLSNGVDAQSTMEPFLENPVFDQTLRVMDVANGCGLNCDTCLADAVAPSNLFTYNSLEKLFSDPRFLQMLQPDSFRVGSTGDISDHPQAIELVEMMLKKTTGLDRKRIDKEGEHHLIKIFTNYRKGREAFVEKLLKLAEKHPDRLRITISLPLNRKSVIVDQFKAFMAKNPQWFTGDNVR